MAKLDVREYEILDIFVKETLRAVAQKRMSVDGAHAEIMHVLTAIDKNNDAQVLPYMVMRLKEWREADA